jgi:hypothetical protein
MDHEIGIAADRDAVAIKVHHPRSVGHTDRRA